MEWNIAGRWAAATAIGVASLTLAAAAQARDVTWSVGIGPPGAQVIVGNAPVYVSPPVVVYEEPRYYRRPPVYHAPPVYYEPPPVYYQPRQIYYGPPAHFHGHRHGRGHDRHDRHDRGHRGHGDWRR